MKNRALHISSKGEPKIIFFRLHEEFVAAARQGNFQQSGLQPMLQTNSLTAKPSVAVLGTASDALSDEFFIRNAPENLHDTVVTQLRNCNAVWRVEVL